MGNALSNWWQSLTRRSVRRMPPLIGAQTSAGVSVSPEASLQVSAVLSSVRLVSESVAGLPVSLVMKRNGVRLPPPKKFAGLARVLTEQPNPTMDAGEFWRTVVAWILIRGNSYVFVERNGAGQVIGLWPVPPSNVEVKRTTAGTFAYTLSHDGVDSWLPVKTGYVATDLDVLHFRWFGMGAEGLSPIGVARQQVGISVASIGYIGRFFQNDATPGAVMSVPGNLSDAQYDRLMEQLEERHSGFDNAHLPAIYEGGAKLERTALSPADAQFIEIYKMTRTEIAALYGVPPHKIGDLEHATFSNIEHQSIEFVQDALVPVINRLEKVVQRLFGEGSELRLKFDVNGLLRGDTAARTASYAAGRQWGWYSINDIRRMEDQPPVPHGDEYLTPANMMSVAEARSLPGRVFRSAPAAAEVTPGWLGRVERRLAEFFDEQRDAVIDELLAGRGFRTLSAADIEAWDELLAETLAPMFAGIIYEFGSREAQALNGAFDAGRTDAWVKAATLRQARNINLTTFDQVEGALEAMGEDDKPRAVVNGVFDQAQTERAGLVAAAVVNTVGAFGSHEGAAQAGGRMKTWIVNSSNPRASHAAMNGESVPIDEPFSNGCMWPGDPNGGADESAGCHCGVEYDL